MTPSAVTPSAEDLKIITLARSTRARVAASEGAAVRDETGRTYTAAAVALPSLRLSALRLAVAIGDQGYTTAGSTLFYAGKYYTQIVSTSDDPKFAAFALDLAWRVAP